MKYQLWIQYENLGPWVMIGFYPSSGGARDVVPNDAWDYEIVEVRTKHA